MRPVFTAATHASIAARLPGCRSNWPQHNQAVECEGAALADHERVDVDRFDHVGQLLREAAEIDQRIEQGIAVAGLATAKALEQTTGVCRLDHGEGLVAIEAGRAEAHVLDQLDQDAAES